MGILFKNAKLPDNSTAFVAVEGNTISYVGKSRPAGTFSRELDCENKLLMSGLYNTHSHLAMTCFRGYAEDMALQKWLDEKILPAEDKLTGEKVYWASLLAMAEQIRNGIVSFSDMYFFSEMTAKAALESGMKANIARCLVSFDPDSSAMEDSRFLQAKSLWERFNNEGSGRIIVDMSLHAEYTNTEKYTREIAEYCMKTGQRMQIHLSETKYEHEKCISQRGMTPTEFFDKCGLFNLPVTCAHCVWVSDDDMDILKKREAFVSHNPASNLKLGSGIMQLAKMLDKEIMITLGTDGAASNNTLDIFKEAYLAAILGKGSVHNAQAIGTESILNAATRNGALSQGRADCGEIRQGYKADIILVDLNSINNIPSYDMKYTALYSACARDVCMNMVDGKILYENGQFMTLDIEKIKRNFKDLCDFS